MSTNNENPRLYSRGYDQIHLDEYIKALEAGFSQWYGKIKAKDKDKEAIRDAYIKMVSRLNENPETLVPEYGGGFRDTLGVFANNTKGVDPYGYVTHYLNTVLQEMPVYKMEEPTPWNEQEALSNAIKKELWGNGPENIQYFMDLDTFDSKTNSRPNIERSKRFMVALNNIKNNFDNLFTNITPEQKKTTLDKIDQAIKLGENGYTSNEYYLLNQLLGDFGYDKIFSGKKTYSTEQAANEDTFDYSGFYQWLNNQGYSSSVNEQSQTITYNAVDPALDSSIDEMFSNINDKNQLLAWLRYGLFEGNPIGKLLPRQYTDQKDINQLTNEYLVVKILNRLRVLNGLKQTTNGYYLIPGLSSKNKSEIFIWDPNNNTIYIENALKYKNFRDSLMNAYKQTLGANTPDSEYAKFFVQYQKKGGIIKANTGTQLQGQTDWRNALSYDDKELAYTYDPVLKTWRVVTDADKATNIKNPKTDAYDEIGDATEIEQSEMWKDWNYILGVNDKVAKLYGTHYNEYKPKDSPYGENFFNPDGSVNYDEIRNFKPRNDQQLGPAHHIIKGRTYFDPETNLYYNTVPEGYSVIKDFEDLGGLAYKYTLIKNSEKTSDDTSEEKTSKEVEAKVKEDNKVEDDKSDDTFIFGKNQEEDRKGKVNPWNKIVTAVPGLMAATRLAETIRHNNSLPDILDVPPVQKEISEKAAIVKGDFDTRQAYHQAGADVAQQAGIARSSDANTQIAQELAGAIKQAEHNTKGDIIDNDAVYKSVQDWINTMNANSAARTANANENRTNRYNYNVGKAQTEALRRQSNFQSVNQFIGDAEERLRAKLEQEHADQVAFYEANIGKSNYRKYQKEIEQIDDIITSWKLAHTGENIASKDWYKQLVKRKKELYARLDNDNMMAMSKLRGWDYSDLYVDNPYVEQSNWNTIVPE